MNVDLRDILPGILNYPATVTYALAQSAYVRYRARASVERHSVGRVRSDITYFLPVLVWGIESVLHAHQAMFGPSRFCFGVPVWAYVSQALLSAVLGALLIAGGFLSERWARRGGLAVRGASAALPLPVVAALVAVQLNWSLHLVAYIPFR